MPRVKLSIVFESGARTWESGAEGIRETGSISAAARAMGMPYKQAGMLLDSMNRAFAEQVIEAALGGARRGATLTRFGAECWRGIGGCWRGRKPLLPMKSRW